MMVDGIALRVMRVKNLIFLLVSWSLTSRFSERNLQMISIGLFCRIERRLICYLLLGLRWMSLLWLMLCVCILSYFLIYCCFRVFNWFRLAHLPHSVPQILINKTPINHINPDIILLGDADDIVHHLCKELRWDLPQPPSPSSTPLSSQSHLAPRPVNLKRLSAEVLDRWEPRRVGNSHVWLFDGAEGGRWVQQLQESFRVGAEDGDDAAARILEDAVSSSEPHAKKIRIGWEWTMRHFIIYKSMFGCARVGVVTNSTTLMRHVYLRLQPSQIIYDDRAIVLLII